MYLLENTGEWEYLRSKLERIPVKEIFSKSISVFSGDFVRSNGLQEGDFIVIYSDVKCGKYV